MDKHDAVPATQDAQHGPVSFTILRPTRGNPSKEYGPDGKRKDYDPHLHLFHHREERVHDVDGLHGLICCLAEQRDSLIIPGRIRDEAGPIVNRRKLANPSKSQPPDVVDAPVRWGCFDVDYLPCPIPIRSAPEQVARYVADEIAKVFPGFDRLARVVQVSNSAGQPGNEYTAKLHFWFLLDRPWSLLALKEIVKKANQRYRELNPDLADRYQRERDGKVFKLIDDALFQATQPHFVANPKFVDGAVDPMPRRVWLEDGDLQYLTIDPADFPDLPATPSGKARSGQGQRGKSSTSNASASAASEHRQKVTKPCHITGNHSRNRYFIRIIRKTLAQFGPQLDRKALADKLRKDLQKSKADPADIQRWSTDTYLLREIENCIQFSKRQVVSHFGLNPTGHQLTELSQRYLPPLPLAPGVLLVKSPMNSGKTHALKVQVYSCKRVLVLVHRQSLAKELARRLNLECYLDIRNQELSRDKMVVCINSLHRVIRTDFDLVVIEESEQLLRSLANLPRDHKPNINHDTFQECVRRGGQVVALDAQLSDLTVNTLAFIRPNERFTIWHNSFGQDKLLRCHRSRPPLILAYELAVAARSCGEGKPVALLSNSRTLLHQQYERTRKAYPQLRIALITSKTTGNDDIQALLKNFDAVGDQYDVILASPTMSTGISIEKLDFRVFGAFDASINCHTDIAQAIARFRLAREVNIYVAEGKAPTHSGQQIVEARLKALRDQDIAFINDGSQPSFRADLYLRVSAYEEQSKGLLGQNFLFLAEEAGWTLHFMPYIDKSNIFGAALLKQGKTIESKVRTERLLAAKRLTDRQLEELATKQLPTSSELDDKERTRMERFYARPISPELIKRDDRSTRQKGIRNLELLREDRGGLLAEDRAIALSPDALNLSFKSKAMMKELWPLFLRAVGLPVDGRLEGFEVRKGEVVHTPEGQDQAESVFAGWSRDTLDPAALQEIDQRRLDIKAFLGRSVPKNFLDEPTGFINQMLGEGLGIPIQKSRPRTEDSDERARHYTLHPGGLQALKADLLRRTMGQAGLITIDDPDDAETEVPTTPPTGRSTPSSIHTSKPGGGPDPDSSTTDSARRHDTHGKESPSPANAVG